MQATAHTWSSTYAIALYCHYFANDALRECVHVRKHGIILLNKQSECVCYPATAQSVSQPCRCETGATTSP